MVISATDRWSVGQGVKTPPFHGGNTGSNPVRTIGEVGVSPTFFLGINNTHPFRTLKADWMRIFI